jgi:hypothetical protein
MIGGSILVAWTVRIAASCARAANVGVSSSWC